MDTLLLEQMRPSTYTLRKKFGTVLSYGEIRFIIWVFTENRDGLAEWDHKNDENMFMVLHGIHKKKSFFYSEDGKTLKPEHFFNNLNDIFHHKDTTKGTFDICNAIIERYDENIVNNFYDCDYDGTKQIVASDGPTEDNDGDNK